MEKLSLYGVRGLAGGLIGNYLHQRKQITIINGTRSGIKKVVCGVPQGSILGPLLFLVYINDLPAVTSLSVKLFADDACLLKHDKDSVALQHIVNAELEKVNDWMKINKLSINGTKTSYMVFTKRKKKLNIKIKLQD